MLRLKNPLGFPGGNPGVNWGHIALGSQPRFSGVAIPGSTSFANLGIGGRGTSTIAGAPTSAMGVLGPVWLSGTSGYVNFSGRAATNDALMTIAAMVMQTGGSASANVILQTSGSSNTGWDLRTSSLQVQMVAPAVAAISSGINLTLNVPYFIAASINASKSSFLVLNLLTGQINTAAVSTGSTPLAPNGVYTLGSDNSGRFWVGQIAAVMASAQFMSVPQLLQWAQAPWDFWYPRTFDGIFLSGLKKVVAAPTHFSRGFPDGGVQVT